MYQFFKEPSHAFGFLNVILLSCNHRHVSATHVAIFKMKKTRMRIQFCTLSFITLKMATRVAEAFR